MFRTLIVAAATLAIGAVGLSSAYAETPDQPAQATTTADAAKTSDRTPGDATPDRTPGASISGAAGTEAAETPEGTSDRTPAQATTTADAAKSSSIGNPFTMEDARNHLAQLGYKNVSELVKDADGKWVGSADKDGKTVVVAVDVKGNVAN